MSAEIIHLNRFRKTRDKARDRAAGEKQAAENRAKFGRTKAEKQLTKTEAERAAARHEQLRLDPAPPAAKPERGEGE